MYSIVRLRLLRDTVCNVQRIKLAKENSLKFRDAMLEVQLVKITVADLWTIIEPTEITSEEYKQIKEEVPAFIPGWLTDNVCTLVLLLKG